MNASSERPTSRLRIEVPGTPIGGEDARESKWVNCISQSCMLSAVKLQFSIESQRNVDLDNLVRPAMRGLKKAGFYSRGFPELSSLTAIKCDSQITGLAVESGTEQIPGQEILNISFDSIPPSENTNGWKLRWSAVVSDHWSEESLNEPVWISISVNTQRSLVELLKPIIDGLEAFLGRDPAGRFNFCPNDHLVEWLQIRRTEEGPALRFLAGLLK